MRTKLKCCMLLALLALPFSGWALKVDFTHKYPCNLFELGKTVEIKAKAMDTGGKGAVTFSWEAVNFWGDTAASGKEVVKAAGNNVSTTLKIKDLDRGHYELNVSIMTSSGKKAEGKAMFGVATFRSMSREEAREKGLRFGMRHRNREYEGLDACLLLGMPWERNLYINPKSVAKSKNPEEWDWENEHAEYRKHVVDREILFCKKLELFPEFAYDAERYGPMEDYKDPVGKHGWEKRTVPAKEPYKLWVRELVKNLPMQPEIYEVWNEPWGKYPPEDFANILKWSVEAIKEVEPNALVGPDTGNIGYDIELAKHGAFENVDLVTIHPYVGHPEQKGVRSKIRRYHEFLKEHVGRDMPLYTTEWGFGTSFGKQNQANYMVRQAVAMYAEDMKALIPYIFTPSRKEWNSGAQHYGYATYDFQPLAAFLAYANCARMIDGSRFVGDLWMGEYIGALLFERDGVYTAIFWTDEKERPITFDPKASSVIMADVMGVEKKVQTNGKPLELTLTDAPIYIVGVGAQVEKETVYLDPINKRWPYEQKEIIRHAGKADPPPSIDAAVSDAEWQDALIIPLENGKIDEKDGSGQLRMLWDTENLYFAVEIKDDDPMYNPHEDIGVFKGDSIELYICAKPEMRIPETRGQYDYQVVVSPTSGTGEPVNYFPSYGSVTARKLKGEKMAFEKTSDGWVAELALPLENFPGFPTEAGKKAAFEVIVNDLDKDNPVGGRDKLRPVVRQGSKWHRDAALWSTLVLEK